MCFDSKSTKRGSKYFVNTEGPHKPRLEDSGNFGYLCAPAMCASTSSDGEDDRNSNASLNTIGRPEFEYGIRTMPPFLAELLETNGCKLFLNALRKAGRLERSKCNGITILAPNDNAFSSGQEDTTKSSSEQPGVHTVHLVVYACQHVEVGTLRACGASMRCNLFCAHSEGNEGRNGSVVPISLNTVAQRCH